MDTTILGYIDPNTSQHVFNLLGPILACLTATGGFVAATALLVRHRIASYFRNASWTKGVLTVCVGVSTLAIAVATIWLILW
jgi:hypothetical protein